MRKLKKELGRSQIVGDRFLVDLYILKFGALKNVGQKPLYGYISTKILFLDLNEKDCQVSSISDYYCGKWFQRGGVALNLITPFINYMILLHHNAETVV